MRIASKSAIGFARSKGLERNKVSSTSHGISLPPAAPKAVAGRQWPLTSTWLRAQELNRSQLYASKLKLSSGRFSSQRRPATGNCFSIRFQKHAARLLRGRESVGVRRSADHG